jgi:hypothetical protein
MLPVHVCACACVCGVVEGVYVHKQKHKHKHKYEEDDALVCAHYNCIIILYKSVDNSNIRKLVHTS